MGIAISVKDMFTNGVHFGHKTSRWNPKMKKNIFGKRSGLHIIDLEKTATAFEKALNFIHTNIAEGKTMLWVATKGQTAVLVKEFAEASKTPFVVNRWLGGTLTNFRTIKARIRRLKTLEKQIETGELEKYTKKEQSKYKVELEKLEKTLGGLREMHSLPDLIFVTDINSDHLAITEAKKMGIPVVGLSDTNTDPTKIEYAIPSNDDAVNALNYMFGILNEVIVDAQNNPKKKETEKGEKTYKVDDKVIAEKEAGATEKKAPVAKKHVVAEKA